MQISCCSVVRRVTSLLDARFRANSQPLTCKWALELRRPSLYISFAPRMPNCSIFLRGEGGLQNLSLIIYGLFISINACRCPRLELIPRD